MLALINGKPANEPSFTLYLSGATNGTLAPCGCTKPMSGGIKRRTQLIRTLHQAGDLVIECGPISALPGRQSELKAETLAQSLRVANTNFVAVSKSDEHLGEGVRESIARLSRAPVAQFAAITQQVINGTTIINDPGVSQNELVDAITPLATTDRVVLLTQRSLAEIKTLAANLTNVDLVAVRSTSKPFAETFGRTTIVSSGDEGKHVIALSYTGDRFEAFRSYELGPDVTDDPTTARYYKQYLDRLRSERLVEAMPKSSAEAYAGSKACRSCHEPIYQIWSKTRHAKAWATLEFDGHDADPDCAGCHSVGIESTGGFLIKERTPHLTNVGCESCHGPGTNHVARPREVPMPSIGEASCQPCHKLNHSPNFKFELYWEKVKH
jgi:hypothetical protein